MSAGHDPAEAIGQVTHYFSHRSVAAVRLSAPLALGDKIHTRGHTTGLVQNVASMEVEHAKVDRAGGARTTRPSSSESAGPAAMFDTDLRREASI